MFLKALRVYLTRRLPSLHIFKALLVHLLLRKVQCWHKILKSTSSQKCAGYFSNQLSFTAVITLWLPTFKVIPINTWGSAFTWGEWRGWQGVGLAWLDEVDWVGESDKVFGSPPQSTLWQTYQVLRLRKASKVFENDQNLSSKRDFNCNSTTGSMTHNWSFAGFLFEHCLWFLATLSVGDSVAWSWFQTGVALRLASLLIWHLCLWRFFMVLDGFMVLMKKENCRLVQWADGVFSGIAENHVYRLNIPNYALPTKLCNQQQNIENFSIQLFPGIVLSG